MKEKQKIITKRMLIILLNKSTYPYTWEEIKHGIFYMKSRSKLEEFKKKIEFYLANEGVGMFKVLDLHVEIHY